MLARAVAALVLAVAPLVGLAASAAAASPDSVLPRWVPEGDGWSESYSGPILEVWTQQCGSGGERQFTRADGSSAGVVWLAGCGTAEHANAMLNQMWHDAALYPAVGVEPALGEGFERDSRFVGPGTPTGIQRLWVQGDTVLWVYRSCVPGDGDDDAVGCLATTAREVLELSAALDGQPVALVMPTRADGDHFGSWAPPDDNGWDLVRSAPIDGSIDGTRCPEGVSSAWTGTDGARVEVFWVRCPDQRSAQAFFAEYWIGLQDADVPLVFGDGIDRVAEYERVAGVPGVTRSWVQGDTYVNVQRSCPATPVEQCVDLTAQYAVELERLLPGDPVVDTSLSDGIVELALWLAIVPVLTLLLLTVPRRLVAWLRTRGYSTETDNPRFTAVDRFVRRVRIGRFIRRTIIVVGSAVLYVVGWYVIPGMWPKLIWTVFGPFLAGFALTLLLHVLWRPNPLIRLARRRRRLRPLDVASLIVRAIAISTALVAIACYIFGSLILLTDRISYTRATIDAQTANLLASGDGLSMVMGALRWLVHALDDLGTYWLLFFGMLAVPMFAAYLIDRFGQRLAARSLTDAIAEDTRPYFLYLRGFDEDKLRIDESIGRQGFIELFTPFGRPRFEELLAQYLNQYGPVIAIAPTKQVLSDLGAAKVSLGDGEWQDRVREWFTGARAVVMSATPREVRAGLEWEMEQLATAGLVKRLMLVVAPYSRAEVTRRFRGFLERADDWPLFKELVDERLPSGVQVMTWSDGEGWRGYGAKRRWDWAYAASILTAHANGDLGPDPESEPPAGTPEPAPAGATAEGDPGYAKVDA